MKRLSLLIVILLPILHLGAQDLHIYYDVMTQTPRYVVDSQEVKRPYVRRGANVILHLENYNNYLYDVVIEQENREIRLPSTVSGTSLTQLFPMLGQNTAGFLPTGGSRSAGDRLGIIGMEGDRGAPRPFDAALGISRQEFEQLNRMVEQFNTALQHIQEIETAFEEDQKEVQSIIEAHQINAFVMEEIEQIKRHPGLPPDKIKEMARHYMNKVLGLKNGEQIDLNFLLQKGNTRRQLTSKLEEIRLMHNDYRTALATMNSIRETAGNVFGSKMVVNSLYVTPMSASYQEANLRDKDYTEFENRLIGVISQMPDMDMVKLAALWREYEALQSNTFSKDHRVIAKGDELAFNIRFTPSAGNAQRAVALPTLQIAPIEVPVAGSFKVNASIGIGFGQFFQQQEAYFVRDQRIRAEDKDAFYPVVSSFFHFYGQSKGATSFGGSFGIGLPITGDAAGQSASFFLGPSLIIGRAERLVLSGGLMGARAERLAQGFQVGDLFVSSSNTPPTKNIYETGFFLGLSFNVLPAGR